MQREMARVGLAAKEEKWWYLKGYHGIQKPMAQLGLTEIKEVIHALILIKDQHFMSKSRG